MIKNILLFCFIIFSISSKGQCAPPSSVSSGCVYNGVVTSSDGYQVLISVTPSHLLVPTSCQFGYGSNAVLNYNIQFTGSNIPSSLWNLQFSLGCDPFNYTGAFPTNGGIGSATSNNNPYRSASDCATVSFDSLGCDVLNITISGPGISSQTITLNCEAQLSHPAEGTFGENEWLLYGYEGNNFQTYKGYFEANTLDFDTRNHFSKTLSPSSAANYEGCAISNNNHSYRVKREGFPCGYYKIHIPGHDRRMILKVNGTEVYSQNNATNTLISDVWIGFLNENSTIEFSIRSFNADSYGAIDLENVYGDDFKIWLGTVDTNFNNANNWCDGEAPSSNDSVLIPSTSVNAINISSNTTILNLYISENAVLNISNDKTLTINGNVTNHGIINAEQSKLIFNGSNAQNIEGNGFEVEEFTLNNSNGLSLDLLNNDLLVISKLLTVTSGSLHTNNQIYLPCDYISGGDECSFISTVTSSNGYDVEIEVTPKQVITANNSCANGYNYNIEYEYNVQFSGSNIPSSVYTLNAYLTCDGNDSLYFGLPTSGGSGIATTTANPYRNVPDCATATVNSIGCNALSIVISGPGITEQTINMICDYGISGGAAQIAEIGGEIDGNVTVEQCFTALRAYRFITSSVTTTGSIRENWQENASSWHNNPNPGYGTHITGVGNGADGTNGFDFNPSGAASMFTFNNNTQQWSSIANTNIDQLLAGKPYRLLVRGSRNINLQSNNATPTNTKIRSNGTVVKGPYSVPALSNIAGNFNFIGNPFHAKVDINAVLSEATNVTPYVYFWDPTIATRGAYVTINPANNSNNNLSSDANKYLQPFQAIFVQTSNQNTVPMITFKESHKAVNQLPSSTFKTMLSENGYINLTLYNADSYQNNLPAADGVRIDFLPNGSNGVDLNDAIKVSNIDENLSIKNDASLLSIEQRNIPTSADFIPLHITNYKTNNYIFRIKAESIQGVNAYLKDFYTNTQTLIETSSDTYYSFNVNNQIEESISTERFAVVFENEVLNLNPVNKDNIDVFPNPFETNFYVNLHKSYENVFVSILNMQGQKVYEAAHKSNEFNQIEIKNLQLVQGNYILNVTTNEGENYNLKLLKK